MAHNTGTTKTNEVIVWSELEMNLTFTLHGCFRYSILILELCVGTIMHGCDNSN